MADSLGSGGLGSSSAVSLYYPSPRIDPVRNAVSSSERTSLQRSSLPTQRARRTDSHTETVCVCVCVYTAPHTHTHTVGSRRREGRAKLPALLLLPLPTCQLVCDLPLQSAVVLMCNVHRSSLSLLLSLCLLGFSLSLSLSLPPPVPFSLTLPHCLQLHLFPSVWQMIAGLFFFFSWYSSPASARPLLTLSSSLPLSLCPFSPSQLPTMPFFFLSSCSLSTPCSRPSPNPKGGGGGQTKCTFIVCEAEKESKRDTEKGKRGHSRGHYCPSWQWWLLIA